MNRGEPSFNAASALSTKGSEAEEDLMWRANVRSRELMTMGWIRKDGSIGIVLSGIEVILPRKSISRSHVHSRGNFPDEIKVLKKKGPASLSSREFAQVF